MAERAFILVFSCQPEANRESTLRERAQLTRSTKRCQGQSRLGLGASRYLAKRSGITLFETWADSHARSGTSNWVSTSNVTQAPRASNATRLMLVMLARSVITIAVAHIPASDRVFLTRVRASPHGGPTTSVPTRHRSWVVSTALYEARGVICCGSTRFSSITYARAGRPDPTSRSGPQAPSGWSTRQSRRESISWSEISCPGASGPSGGSLTPDASTLSQLAN